MISHVFDNIRSKPATRLYPFEKREPPPGARGHLVNDPAACVYCGLCQRRCPAMALRVERKPKTWTLDRYRCILCGYCVEICPKQSLSMNPGHAPIPSWRDAPETRPKQATSSLP
jgi:NADH-quinone oxidoreductase subunit I